MSSPAVPTKSPAVPDNRPFQWGPRGEKIYSDDQGRPGYHDVRGEFHPGPITDYEPPAPPQAPQAPQGFVVPGMPPAEMARRQSQTVHAPPVHSGVIREAVDALPDVPRLTDEEFRYLQLEQILGHLQAQKRDLSRTFNEMASTQGYGGTPSISPGLILAIKRTDFRIAQIEQEMMFLNDVIEEKYREYKLSMLDVTPRSIKIDGPTPQPFAWGASHVQKS